MSGANGNVIISGWEMDITLTMQQQKRIEIVERALRNNLTVVEAAMVLGGSVNGNAIGSRHGLGIREPKE
jgi:hypothetical protein